MVVGQHIIQAESTDSSERLLGSMHMELIEP